MVSGGWGRPLRDEDTLATNQQVGLPAPIALPPSTPAFTPPPSQGGSNSGNGGGGSSPTIPSPDPVRTGAAGGADIRPVPLTTSQGAAEYGLYPPLLYSQKIDEDTYLLTAWFRDARGGIFRTMADFAEGHNRTFDAYGLETRYKRTGITTALQSATTFASASVTAPHYVHHANVFGTLIFGWDNVADNSYFKPTSSSDMTPVTITGTPPSNITHMGEFYCNGDDAQKLIVCYATDPPRIFTNASLATEGGGTGAMHASLDNSYWAVQTPLPDPDNGGFYQLVMANGSIFRRSSEDAHDADPGSAVTVNVRNGGFLLGICQLLGRPNRVYFTQPKSGTTTGNAGSEIEVWSCNFEGTDLQRLEFPGLGLLSSAMVFGNSIVASDFGNIHVHHGTHIEDLLWAEDIWSKTFTFGQTNHFPRVRGFIKYRDQIGVLASISSGTTIGYAQLAAFDPITRRWHWVANRPAFGVDLDGFFAAGGFPFNESSQVSYIPYGANTQVFVHRQFAFDAHRLPQTTLSSTAGGSGISAGFEGFTGHGAWLSPRLNFPGFEGWAKTVVEIIYTGDCEDAIAGAGSVDIGVGGYSDAISAGTPFTLSSWYTGGVIASFPATTYKHAQSRIFPNGSGSFDLLQIGAVVNRDDSDVDVVPNLFPFAVRFYAKRPRSMRLPPPPKWMELPYGQ